MNSLKIKTTVAIVVALALLVQGARTLIRFRQQKMVLARQLAKSEGNPRAGVKIVEFTDFQCPACANGDNILRQYRARFPHKIYVEYKHFPLMMHPKAMPIALAAECAARQKKFWPFHDLAFERQNLLRESVNLSGRLTEIAAASGLDQKAFQSCLADPQAQAAVQRDQEEGKVLKVGATPTYFINGKMFVGSTQLAQELEKSVGRLP